MAITFEKYISVTFIMDKLGRWLTDNKLTTIFSNYVIAAIRNVT